MGVDAYIHVFLTSALDGVISFTLRPLYPREITPGTHSTGGRMGPRTDLDDVERRKIFLPPGLELKPLGRPVRSQSLRYPSSRLLYPLFSKRTVYNITLQYTEKAGIAVTLQIFIRE
jgi:hypothetical protein